MKIIKKNSFDICAGDCATCVRRGIKNLSLLTIYTKKKISTKYVPPDMGAIKLLIDMGKQENKDIFNMTDAELKSYEEELMQFLGVYNPIKKSTEDDHED